MAEVRFSPPEPEVRGVGSVRYRCARCGEMMEVQEAVILDGQSYHKAHIPEENDGR